QPAGESRRIWHVLSLRDDESRDKLASAVRRATKARMKSVLVFGSDDDRKMITVRPAREEGLAVVTCTDLVAAISALDHSALADPFLAVRVAWLPIRTDSATARSSRARASSTSPSGTGSSLPTIQRR